jgi:hypothetical protein
MSSESGQIYELLPKAIAAVPVVGKTNSNKAQGYNFRGVDNVITAVNPVLSGLGISVVREIVKIQREANGETRSGNPVWWTLMHCRFRLYAPDGSYVSTDAFGEGMDAGGDKSANKAMSAAYKYALCHVLLIPTEDRSDPEWDRAESREDVVERRSLAKAKTELAQAFSKMRRDAGIAPNRDAAMAARDRIFLDVLETTDLTSAEEADAIRATIERGDYDPETGERIPETTAAPQGELL